MSNNGYRISKDGIAALWLLNYKLQNLDPRTLNPER
jgi:hypothetical protein